MKLFLTTFLSLTSSLAANAATFTCKLESHQKVQICGSLDLNFASIQIADADNFLALREVKPSRIIHMDRSLRKTEDQYGFANYYSDLSAWQDVELSVPKSVRSKTFKAYLTIYSDDGDRMVPGGSEPMTCTAE